MGLLKAFSKNQRGYRLQHGHNDNYAVLPDPDHPGGPVGLLLKANYWIWRAAAKPGGDGADRDLAGNTIDFFVQIEGQTFHQAMEIITAAQVSRPALNGNDVSLQWRQVARSAGS